MKNYVDNKGNYINCENLTLKEIYDRGFSEGYKKGYIDSALQRSTSGQVSAIADELHDKLVEGNF